MASYFGQIVATLGGRNIAGLGDFPLMLKFFFTLHQTNSRLKLSSSLDTLFSLSL